MTTKLKLGLVVLIVLANADHVLAADPEKDPQMYQLLKEGRTLIESKKPEAAIEKCDKVIAAYKAAYGSRKERINCARSSAESLGYLMKGVVDKKNTVALSSLWADAYFMKGYALQDLGRLAEAKRLINQALQFSPFNSQYLCELGEIYELEKNWPKAMQCFKEAEDNNTLAPDESRALELGQARRGMGYVFVELGKLDEAEKKYEQCLKSDRNDTRAARELEYVRQLRNKQKSN